MAGFSHTTLPGEPVIILAFYKNYDMRTELSAAIDEGTRLLDAADGPVFYITDMTEELPFNIQDLISVTSSITRTGNAILHHPNMGEYLLVTRNPAMKVAMKGLNSPAFGNVPARAFDTVDEALAYARSKV